MIFTLHRYILRELMKVFVMTTVALTMIMSLGTILRPVQEYGIGPDQVIHIMGYFVPIILTYVLPIAALFACSMVYGRFASDNELDACKASGIGLMTLVYPGFVLAVIVAIANVMLSFNVIPTFVQRAEKAIKADAQKIIFRNIQRKGYYKPSQGSYLLYADHADMESHILSGVVITQLKATQAKGLFIEKIIAAEKASVNFNANRRFNEVQITAYNTYQMGTENVWFLGLSSFTEQFPPMLSDDISFKKIGEMNQIKANPIKFLPVERIARQIYAQFTAELLVREINNKIADFPNNYYSLYSGEKFIDFTADDCRLAGEKKIELTGDVRIVEYDSDKTPVRTLETDKAILQIEGDEMSPMLTMQVYHPKLLRMDGSQDLARRQFIRGLILPQSITGKFKTEDTLKAIEPQAIRKALQEKPSQKLVDLQSNLQYRIQKTLVQIVAEINARLAFGIGCVPLIMIGIGLGIIKKGGHLLSAFGVSFIPAVGLIVCIMMGKNIAKNPVSEVSSGIILMWAGVLVMVVLCVWIYRKLLKN